MTRSDRRSAASARPAEGLPHFDTVTEDHRAKFPCARAHAPHHGSQVRVERDHQGWFAARRSKRRPGELNLAPRIAGS